jgi:hypothetical protein
MIGAQHSSLDVKLCLPAEIYQELKGKIFRADKDFHQNQYLYWTPTELMHLAATRLRVFFQLHDSESFDLVKDQRLSERSILRKFWNRFLPNQITNSLGTTEETFAYILRHTQLLPRQLLTVLNSIARRFSGDGGKLFARQFTAQEIVQGIQDSEDSNAQAVLGMYTGMYPLISEVFERVLPRLERVFDYGFLHKAYNTSAKLSMAKMSMGDFHLFWRLLLSTGAIGVVDQDLASDTYSIGKFEFNSEHLLLISEKDKLCVHPMFSRIYNIARSGNSKVVLPRGSEFGLEEQ